MLAGRLPLPMGDSDSRVLVAAGDKPNRPALERHMTKRIVCLRICVMLGASPGINGQSDSVAPGHQPVAIASGMKSLEAR
jgi:hypothetical protein